MVLTYLEIMFSNLIFLTTHWLTILPRKEFFRKILLKSTE